MKAGLVGPSSQQRSLPFNAERTVNYLVVVDEDGKTPAALVSRPGLNLFGVIGPGPGRGALTAQNGRSFEVSGNGFYELFSDGTSTLRGNIDQSSGYVTMAENGLQMAICDQASLYIFTYDSNSFSKVINTNLPSAYSVTFIGGYFVVNKSLNSGIFQISAPYNGTSWAALDFATAETLPDSLVRVINISGQLWLVGSSSIEIWSNTGAANFPFERTNSAAVLTVGTSSPFSVVELDNTMFWVGKNDKGQGIVYRADGFSPKRVSTDAIDMRIQKATDPSTLRGMVYQESGHTYYIITGGGMETAPRLDLATNIWTEDCFLNNYNQYEIPLQSYIFSAFNKTLALDRTNGNVYVQSLDNYSDNGEEIARDRIFTHVFNQSQRFRIKNLFVYCETGVGNQTGTFTDPKGYLSISQDGGRSFPITFTGLLGKIGRFMERGIPFWRLGSYFQCTFRFRITDPIKVAVNGAEFNVG